jgi:hypothetical protein
MARMLTALAVGLAALGLLALAGCNNPTSPPAPAKDGQGEEHGHKPGQHGGLIVPIGRDSYHAEAVFGKDGVVRVYTLGKDEAVVVEVEAQDLTAFARADGDAEAQEFALKAVRQAGDAQGKTSHFIGTLPVGLRGKRVEVTVPAIRIDGVRYRFEFASAPAGGHGDVPAKVEEEERKLYLTPGGMYTEADIKANGNMTASQKFRGQTASHDLKPKPGDRICPITLTRASPKFTWIVGGRAYEFCCPPCIDEFVQTAKESPGKIKPPEGYVQK